MSRGRFCLDPETRAYLEIVLAKRARPGMCNATDAIPAVDGDPDPFAAAEDTRTTGQGQHDAVKTALRALPASGDLDQHRGLPVTAIITITLQDLESAPGLALTGGGSTLPMQNSLRMAATPTTTSTSTTAPPAGHCSWAAQNASPQPTNASCCTRSTAAAPYPAATNRPTTAKSTTSSNGSSEGTTDIDRLTLTWQDGNLSAGPTDEQWQARRRYDQESLGQTLWYPPKSVDPSRQPKANRHHRRPNRPHPEPDAA